MSGMSSLEQTEEMNKAVIITGASGSMGAEATKALAQKGYFTVMACRNMDKAESVRQDILRQIPSAGITPLQLNLTSISSIRHFVEEFVTLMNEKGLSLSGLFNNAGIINREFGLTEDGYERTVATNYIGPVYLTKLLLPHFADKAHIVNMVSLTCRYGRIGADFFNRPPEKFSQLGTYADTKLALLLFSISLSRYLEPHSDRHIYVNAADPGVVNSNMITMHRWFDPIADILVRPFFSTPQKGVQPALRALESDTDLKYFKGKGYADIPSRYTFLMKNEAGSLWKMTENLIGHFPK